MPPFSSFLILQERATIVIVQYFQLLPQAASTQKAIQKAIHKNVENRESLKNKDSKKAMRLSEAMCLSDHDGKSLACLGSATLSMRYLLLMVG